MYGDFCKFINYTLLMGKSKRETWWNSRITIVINIAPCQRNRWLSVLKEGWEEWQCRFLTLWQSPEWERGDRGWKTATVLALHWQLSSVTVGKFYGNESWYCCACNFLHRRLSLFLSPRALFIMHLVENNNWYHYSLIRWNDTQTNAILSLDIGQVRLRRIYKSFCYKCRRS